MFILHFFSCFEALQQAGRQVWKTDLRRRVYSGLISLSCSFRSCKEIPLVTRPLSFHAKYSQLADSWRPLCWLSPNDVRDYYGRLNLGRAGSSSHVAAMLAASSPHMTSVHHLLFVRGNERNLVVFLVWSGHSQSLLHGPTSTSCLYPLWLTAALAWRVIHQLCVFFIRVSSPLNASQK